MRSIFYILLFLLISAQASAQKNNDEALAIQFFERKEYDKAADYFEKLYDKTPDLYYNYYYKCLVELKDYSKAEKITKKQIKRNDKNVYLYVRLGNLYALLQNPEKEKEQYTKAIKEVIPEQNNLFTLAHAFEEFELYDYAIQTYLKGRKQYSETYPFYYEIADLHKKKGDLKSMINEYLNAIEFRESELYTAQSNLQQSLGYDEKNGGFNNPLLKQELQKKIQEKPDKTIFSEFLIFILNQQKDFESSFVQNKALDKRQKGDGTRLFELAKLCVSNEQYDVAIKCYEYVISKGKDGVLYDLAIIEKLNTQYILLTQTSTSNITEIKLLETNIDAAIKQFGVSNLTLPLIKKSASIKAYYLNDTPGGIYVLENVMQEYSFDKVTVAGLKIELADMNLITGNIWDASLLYSQVEKDFKYEVIGQEAKFKNAKLSYYASDFKWAKSQCDVLKGATTKTIANDALDLSLVITDAIGIDTNDMPLSIFASADLLILQHQYERAFERLDSINLMFSEHTLGDDIYFKKAQVYKTLNRYDEAVKMYQNILEFYPTELYGDDALFLQAEIYDKKLKNIDKAKELYQDILIKYPGSIYVVEARKRYRELRGENLN